MKSSTAETAENAEEDKDRECFELNLSAFVFSLRPLRSLR
jgi:hypothetical protein